MEERVEALEDVVAKQQKSIDTLLDMIELLSKRLDISNKKIDLVKQMAEANVGMINTTNDTLSSLFELINKD